MAEKILTIKVNADTKQVEASFQNVSKYLNDMAGKASFVTTLEKERARVIRSLGDAYGSLKDKISQLNAIQNENLRGGAAKAVENSAAVSKLNAELQKQLELFGKLRAANLGGIPLPKTTATGDSTSISAMMGAAPKPKPASMYVSGGAIGKLTEETRTYTTVAEARAAADAKVAAGAKNLEKVQRSLFESVVQSTIIYKTFTSALQLVQETLANIPAAGIRMQQAQAAATAIFGSAEGLRN